MKKIAILAGGNSGEYEISLKTAANVQKQLTVAKFDTYLIVVNGDSWVYKDANEECFYVNKNDFSISIQGKQIVFDVVFIAIHGDPGENGKLQGYFEMLKIPYTGCDSFCSALTFNKYFCNMAIQNCGVPISPSLHFYKNEHIIIEEVINFCGLPCFVKPCNSGSSVGISKVHNSEELSSAFHAAFEVDKQILVERFVPGRELTCGVTTWKGKVKALAVTEIKSKKEYYDFEAKYTPGYLELVTPAEIDIEVEEKVKKYSEIIFKKLGCKGVVRIDYILNSENEPIFLEINTIPGQTEMSIIPRQLAYNNIPQHEFYANLVLEAI
jgi:D-alanine-D-alanine ligase